MSEQAGKAWDLAEDKPQARAEIEKALGLEPLLSQLLVNRGAATAKEADEMINPKLADISDPFAIPGMDAAAERMALARERKEKVVVYGDFDVDGLTAAAALKKYLKDAGFDASVFVPERNSGSRGLKPAEVDQMKKDGAALIVTVDTGISAVEAADRAAEEGVEMIITDHHIPPENKPRAVALVNPQFLPEGAPGRWLSGAGVAFKLMMATRNKIGKSQAGQPNLKKHLALVAMGTVADCAPLVGENRILVRHGLDEISSPNATPGLAALKSVCRLAGRAVTSRDVAFDLAPRLNSASRMNNARAAMELLITMDAGRATSLASVVDTLNGKRKKIQEEILRQARAMALALTERERSAAIVLGEQGWDPGVIGIVASRLADEFHTPAILVSFDGEEGKGSARSVPYFDMHAALAQASGLLDRFGGHQGAAGLYVKMEKFAAFREAMVAIAGRNRGQAYSPAKIHVDMRFNPHTVTMETVKRLALLEPYGEGFPPPVFLAENMALASPPEFMGEDGRSVRLWLDGRKTPAQMVAFRMAGFFDKFDWRRETLDILFTPEINNWGGSERLQLRAVDIAKGRGGTGPRA